MQVSSEKYHSKTQYRRNLNHGSLLPLEVLQKNHYQFNYLRSVHQRTLKETIKCYFKKNLVNR